MTAINNLIDRLDERINPIIVKELRQIVRGKFFWGVLILFLGFQCVVLSLSLADQNIRHGSAGQETLMFLYGVLFLASFAIIPIYSGFRFSRERSEGSDELLFITTITPQSIIRGKFAASFMIILLINSAFAPFMAMTFFLSGVDLWATFVMLLLGLVVCAGGAMFQICIGSMAREGGSMYLFRGAGLVFQVIMFFSLMGISSEMIRYGLDRTFNSGYLYSSITTFVVFATSATYLLYHAAAAVVSPAGTNRMLPVRVAATILWVVTLLMTGYWAVISSSSEVFIVWGFIASYILSMACLVAVSERDHLTERVAREVPSGFIRQRVAFVFFSGAAGGLAWVLVMQILTFAIVLFVSGSKHFTSYGSASMSSDFFLYSGAFYCYMLGYSLLAAFIRRVFVADYMDIRNTWVVALLTCAVFSIVPILAGGVMGMDSDNLLIANPLYAATARRSDSVLVFAACLAFVSLVINAGWIGKQLREFHKEMVR
ncbi:MAG: ABC transporter permease [Candidatus Riflebacteria bacterium]|nr:ABC transporter permease [Candidatus Riflebacteria bacterium]